MAVGGRFSEAAAFVKSLYFDPFKWSLVKSFSLFALGVHIAKECTGLEIMPPVTQ
ncbi:hypothetical protein L798_13297 [Zootermopsis nevadensis]|uniref:Uncharacterized protein n=1 Tax=Zootermopsis nevadensis TaxID=136037 RepID=A0A067R4U8_ZOONE|nr:hypothetical protein L798_13297 [Zootermopsis nevadensis]